MKKRLHDPLSGTAKSTYVMTISNKDSTAASAIDKGKHRISRHQLQ